MVAAWIRAETGVGSRHGVGQPGGERQLGRFPHGGKENEQRQQGGRSDAEGVCLGVDARDGKGSEPCEEKRHGHAETDIPQPGHDERLLSGRGLHRIAVPETDEGIGTESHTLPSQVDENEAVRQGDHQHGKGEQVQVAEISNEIRVVSHEGGRIEVDDGRLQRSP